MIELSNQSTTLPASITIQWRLKIVGQPIAAGIVSSVYRGTWDRGFYGMRDTAVAVKTFKSEGISEFEMNQVMKVAI